MNEAFAQIQVHEAELLAAERLGNASGATCPVRCEAARACGRASESICNIATGLSDADALTRCERARTSGVGASTSAADCHCPLEQGQ